jgi:hypothetical protein
MDRKRKSPALAGIPGSLETSGNADSSTNPIRSSLRAAVNLKCRECAYDPKAPGTWRAQVEACTCFSCPIWAVRPLTLPRNTPRQHSPQDSAVKVENQTNGVVCP